MRKRKKDCDKCLFFDTCPTSGMCRHFTDYRNYDSDYYINDDDVTVYHVQSFEDYYVDWIDYIKDYTDDLFY